MNQHEPDEAPRLTDSMSFEEAASFLRVDSATVRRAALTGELPTRSHNGELRIDMVTLRVLLNLYPAAEQEGAKA